MFHVEPDALRERLAPVAASFGAAPLVDAAADALAAFTAELIAWNERVNLTGARSFEAIVDEHLADALAIVPHLPPEPFDLVDVGSGGGFPGVPLALLRPDIQATLLEPVGKKRAFLAHVARRLAPGRIHAVAERLEEHLEHGGRGRYDVATSRAVWPAAEWLERARPLLRPSGRIIALVNEGDETAGVPASIQRAPYRVAGRAREVWIAEV